MESNKKAVVAFFALAFLFLAYCGEATKICSETNRNYHGPCMSSKICARACVHEGFDGGYCSARRKRRPPTNTDVEFEWAWPWPRRARTCKCTKKCHDPSSPPGGGELPPSEENPPFGEDPPFGEAPPFAMAGTGV